MSREQSLDRPCRVEPWIESGPPVRRFLQTDPTGPRARSPYLGSSIELVSSTSKWDPRLYRVDQGICAGILYTRNY